MSTLIDEVRRVLDSAVYAHGPLRDAALAVLEIHRPYGIYQDCGHLHEYDENDEVPEGALLVSGVGLTCESGRQYTVCAECCTDDDGMQSEDCGNYHDEPWCCPCPTARAVATALGVSS